MAEPLRVLLLEDSEYDAELILIELRSAGFDPTWQRVDNRDEFEEALDERWDVIFADHNLPQFDSLSALTIALEKAAETPFIIVSGDMADEVAVEAMRSGAFDFVSKERLSHLANSIENALETRRLEAERMAAEAELRASEERYRAVVETAMDAIVSTDSTGQIIYANPAAEKMFGHSRDELLGTSVAQLIPADGRQQFTAAFADLTRAKHLPWALGPIEREGLRADGSRFVSEISLTSWQAEDGLFFTAIVRDTTERRRAEDELRQTLETLRKTDLERKRLLDGLASAQEDERRRIASDIHDDIIQVLSAVSMRAFVVKEALADPEEAAIFEDFEQTVSLATARCRLLMFELLPPILSRDGLSPALKLYLDEAAGTAGFEYTLDNRVDPDLPPELRIIVYRIVQEAVSNVRKHAKASLVEVSLRRDAGGVHVAVADDGAGFRPEDPSLARPGHLGMTAIRDRAALVGGWSRVSSEPGQGTRVEFWVPEIT